jgi:high-affinity Fe2+/Pb2+ permease
MVITVENIIAGVIVAGVLGFAVFRFVNSVRRGKTGCGCGCGASSSQTSLPRKGAV